MTTAACRGFVYATAVMGVTGARATTSDLAGPLVARTRAATDLPVGVGLGVSNGDQAAEVASYADGVIVGSAFVRVLLDHPATGPPASRALPRSPRTSPPGCGVRSGRPGRCSSSLVGLLAGCGDDEPRRRRRGYHGAVLDQQYVVPDTAADRHRRSAVLAGRGHRQAADPGLLRLHATAPTSARW